ncbi:MAG: S-methyl-5-thioribose-1-phosphate isomerase [Acidobacteria bacterium]|nr:S-methyl-5-thioribose-1-phosphate isomerase [Acidobacteriota bacterium]MBU1474982.1 S-methyl-5-thioribose-1-phosphate isomerase [Acidobacteriota bacterium]MBU2438442.1 S-methyl-5-thioribose-1-phosphate isomerase [Acidobacteriota bacterium]MBU4253950.1 S-methyl-5-thioribose-1-phosphate isomerase [Acidobacteriota bacterium]MBU4330354.1 S-methyl-5-thioribose-1-phosphate isomerase [Acidobacteriota bacterium]
MKPTIEWKKDRVVLIDQRKIPNEEIWVECGTFEQAAEAIETMVVRGAPAIGVTAAYGVALGFLAINSENGLDAAAKHIFKRLAETRPTAVNLFWALNRMERVYEADRTGGLAHLKESLVNEACLMDREDVEINRAMGQWGQALLSDGDTVLTHCNAGALATAGYGTALGVIRAAVEAGKKITVYAGETRPFLQGARLTCWELHRDGIPVVLITDNMAGYLMKKGEINRVITGADRIAANGDAANKIGTYSVAVLAREHAIPFYIAAPLSTIDFSLPDGDGIPIEERDGDEVRTVFGRPITLPDIPVRNPAFDVTPARLIKAIITEKGIVEPPFTEGLAALRNKK